MMFMRTTTPQKLLILLLTFGLIAIRAHSHILTALSGQFPQILATATAGDTIRVASGRHDITNMVISTPNLFIIGKEDATIYGNGTGSILTIDAPNVVVKNLKIEHTGRMVDKDDAGIRIQSSKIRIEHCTFSDYALAIYLQRATQVTITKCTFSGDSIPKEAITGNSIHAYLSSGILVESGTFRNGLDGIYFDVCNEIIARHNRMTDVRYGVHFMNCRDGIASDNGVTSSFVGIAAMFSNNVSVRYNRTDNNIRANAYGILLQDVDTAIVEGNEIGGNDNGLLMEATRHSKISDNLIIANRVGMELHSSSNTSRVRHNRFITNWETVVRKQWMHETNYDVSFSGNYFSNAVIPDADGDGYGDAPYRIEDAFTARYAEQPVLSLMRATKAYTIWNSLLQNSSTNNGLYDIRPARYSTIGGYQAPTRAKIILTILFCIVTIPAYTGFYRWLRR